MIANEGRDILELLVRIFGREIIIPDTIVNMWVVVILLIIFALVVNSKIKKASVDDVPSNFLNVVEVLVDSVEGLVRSTMGPQKYEICTIYADASIILRCS